MPFNYFSAFPFFTELVSVSHVECQTRNLSTQSGREYPEDEEKKVGKMKFRLENCILSVFEEPLSAFRISFDEKKTLGRNKIETFFR